MQESSISEKIKELRTDLKMNQKNFSAAIGIRQSTLSSYENGVVTPSNNFSILLPYPNVPMLNPGHLFQNDHKLLFACK